MLLKETIHTVAKKQFNLINEKETGTLRNLLKQLDFSSSHVIIITGIRRCGKSTLLLQIMKQEQKFAFFNFEDQRVFGFDITDFKRLEEIFDKYENNNILFLDEIQNVQGWERYIRTRQDQGIKFVITGSNASLLSKELGTKLTGRHISKELFPFSYKEFLNFTNQTANIESFNKYFEKGGFPEFLKNNNIEIHQQLLEDIIIRDIIARYGLKNSKKIKELAIYLISNTAKEFSYNNLTKLFEFGSVNSVASYISYFEDSYLLFTVPKFSYSIKKQIFNPKKIYAIDVGFVRANSISFSKDSGRLLENIVFLHLRQKKLNIFYFKEKNECDFIIKYKNKYSAIQVCYKLTEENQNREIKGLQEAMENIKVNNGLILTHNQEDEFVLNQKRIIVTSLWKWLSKNSDYTK